MSKEADRIVRETLELVNYIRACFGGGPLKKLRKGRKGDNCECPIAKSIKYRLKGPRSVSVVGTIWVNGDGFTHNDESIAFISDFDTGTRFQEYNLEASR